MKKIVFETDKLPTASDVIPQAVISPQGIAYISGQVSEDAKTGDVVYGSVGEQTTLILTNIKTLVEELGATMDDVLKCTCYVSSMGRVFDEFNEAYGKFFSKGNAPARVTVSAGIWGNLDVEIACEVLMPKKA